MLHGFASNPNQFRKLKKYFENNDYEVLTPTLNNHKDGEENQNFDLKEMIEEMENLCEKINQEGRKITMIGESMGAIITLKLKRKENKT